MSFKPSFYCTLKASQMVLYILLAKCKEASQMVKLPLLASKMVLEASQMVRFSPLGPLGVGAREAEARSIRFIFYTISNAYMTQQASLEDVGRDPLGVVGPYKTPKAYVSCFSLSGPDFKQWAREIFSNEEKRVFHLLKSKRSLPLWDFF